MIDKSRPDGNLDTKSLDAIQESVGKIDNWAEENNLETKESSKNGIQIAKILNDLEVPLEESMENKRESTQDFQGNVKDVIDDKIRKQDEIKGVNIDVNKDLSEKTETEAENTHKMQSATSAVEAGGFDNNIINNYMGKTENNINQLNDYCNHLNETNEKMIETNKQSCNALKSAINSIKI